MDYKNVLRYHMPGYSGYGIQYSPFYDNKLAVATGSNYGLVGNGKLIILDINSQGIISDTNSFMTKDGLFDLCWSEMHENQVVVAQGDGTLRLFDIKLQKYPIAIFKEHQREVLSCNWNLVSKQSFVSSSWDGTVKIWSPMRSQSLITLLPMQSDKSLMTDSQSRKPIISISDRKEHPNLLGNKDCIYQAQFSPHNQNMVMSCSGNSYVTLFDIRQPSNGSNQPRFLAHGGLEALTCDFNKYRPNVIATGGVDKMINIWDLRMIRKMVSHGHQPMSINEIPGHELAVRKVSWSPHYSNILLSTSYDMTCRVWKDLSGDGQRQTGKTNSVDPHRGLISIFQNHTEFVFGGDWSLWGQPGYIATTAWDSQVFVWNAIKRPKY